MKHRPIVTLTLALAAFAAWTATAHAEAPEGEVALLQRHLSHVEATLRTQDVSHLSAELRQAREDNLDALRDYWQEGIFPQNVDFPGERVPYFFDHEDRACAVAHLMVASGHAEEAWAIAARENNAYVHDMTSPELGAWVERSGLTVDEAAWIQPSYRRASCDCVYEPVCDTSTQTTYLNTCMATLNGGEPSDSLVTGCCGPDSAVLVERIGGRYINTSETEIVSTQCGEDPEINDEVDTQWCPDNYDPETAGQPLVEEEGCSTGNARRTPSMRWMVLWVALGVLLTWRRRP